MEVKFKDLLKERKISQAELAKRLEINRCNVNWWCAGKTRPTYESLLRLSEILDVSLEILIISFINTEKKWR